jgi:hypothetical protein
MNDTNIQIQYSEIEQPEIEQSEIEQSEIKYYDNNFRDENRINIVEKSSKTYDDILKSLNFKLNNNGNLIISSSSLEKKKQQHQQQQQHQHVKIDERVKNSAIFNKYFKNYKDPNTVIQEQIPLTKAEYIQQLRINYINQQQAKIRISQIKSKKLMFSNNSVSINTSNHTQFNNLFRIKR